MKHMHPRGLWLPALVALSFMLNPGSGAAKNYVSFDGGFYIAVPDSWNQVDYGTVDAYLLRNRAQGTSLQYEATFAPAVSEPFFAGDYLFLNVDTVGELSAADIDSVLSELQEVFGAGVKYAPVGWELTDLKSSSPVYDADKKLVTILNDVVQYDQPLKKNLMVMKFYQRGIASFYFYCFDSTYERSRPVFMAIVESFSTENLEAVIPQEDLKVVDVEGRDIDVHDDTGAAGGNRLLLTILFVLVAAVLVIVVAVRRRKKT
ncbi:MAG: hypothetical protein OEW00_05905 [candidate division Zixibacteria bacterium]|nr:hypothetical protein [candidate division Zixibacteria bacterium]